MTPVLPLPMLGCPCVRILHQRLNGTVVSYVFGNEVLTRKPEFGSLVAAVIAGWAITETHLGRTFASLVGAKQPVTMSMYEAVRSFETQRDLLRAAATEVLPRRYANLFGAALSVIKHAASDRNKFAHWVWGASADPDLNALFLVEPKQFWKLTTTQLRYWKKKRGKDTIERVGPVRFAAQVPRLDAQHIYVYRIKDLQSARDRVERAYRIADALRQLVDSGIERRRMIYQWLRDDPDIHLALQKSKKKASKRRHPKPPETILDQA
jgi:hypothetical protein